MTDDQFLLASAYADAAVSADERALAEADPEVMAEVGRIRALRAELADVTPAPAAQRASMIAAAMAEFSVDASNAVVTEPEPIRPRHGALRPAPVRRSPFPRVLGMAAAVVAVLAVGGVLVTNLPNSSDDDSAADMSQSTVADDAPASADQSFEATLADSTAAPAATTPAADDGGTSAEPPAAPAGADPDAESRSTEAAAMEAPVPMSIEAMVIEGPDSLREFGLAAGEQDRAASGTEAPEATQPAATSLAPRPACSFDLALAQGVGDTGLAAELEAARAKSSAPVEVLGAGQYRLSPDQLVDVLIAVDLGTSQAYAIDAQTCTLLAVGTPP